ncbi:glycine--tRNA ligase subunit beta [Thiomicrospira sp. ALE5]|uniref:glycine--tRNA ligase subunit beta n=1 Tax=Thiomicrospira sp. ALE5 TaxID=748650 RepID=UPI0008E688EA|nr:glycine--tRNA ligase subunit beta [Thiomicrospira sp. ALE5]SFR52412.1 glycyl-tRNA synthetase beta chain [Thiomicrospira sp. ALE5]
MQAQQDILVEIGTEELPPKSLQALAKSLATGLEVGLQQANLNYGQVQVYAAPRRLAVWIASVQTQQDDQTLERKGPALKAAYDQEGQPTKALLGFARSCGLDVSDLFTEETDKGTWLMARQVKPGAPLTSLLPGLVEQALKHLPIPKPMRWGDSAIEFVRPVHWVVLMLGDQVVPATILGLPTGKTTRGHRFHAPQEIEISLPSEYALILEEQGFVLADFDQRRERICDQVERVADSLDARPVIDEALLDEVTALNEWPHALAGCFDEQFLQVPAECLVSAMKGHQKFFHCIAPNGELMARFITVSNIASQNPAAVVSGNERVIRPRLSDAQFFWNQDLKQPLNAFLPALEKVVFQQQLGTVADKVARLEQLASELATELNVESAAAQRAARLAKCDLMSLMVGEFPELQGTMGRYYAQHQGESSAVAQAIEQHYWPRFAGDDLPQDALDQIIAIADRLDTIVGIYAIGQGPTGDKDPFALRRAALGLARIIIEKDLPLDIAYWVERAAETYAQLQINVEQQAEIVRFIVSRLKSYYQDEGVAAQVFDAVRDTGVTRLVELNQRIQAVRHFASLEQAEPLSAANKRIANILKKVAQPWPDEVNEALFEQNAERALWAAFCQVRAESLAAMTQGDYQLALVVLAVLREPVDAFFDQVHVMTDNAQLQTNRIAMLNHIRQAFLAVADISRLAV